MNRRKFIKNLLFTTTLGLTPKISFASDISNKKKLVVIELSGGNDGLNTLIPYTNDFYYKFRPRIGIPEKKVRKIDSNFGFNPGMPGFEKLYKDGKMAIFHGCGYDQPSFSHFTSMAYYHTAAPNSGERYGWLGRFSDIYNTESTPNFIVNIDAKQSLAVLSKNQVPTVFDEPEKFQRKSFYNQQNSFSNILKSKIHSDMTNQNFLNNVAMNAKLSSIKIRDAYKNYSTNIDYGLNPMDLKKIASLINYEMPTQIYYCAYRNNAFDTHVHQNNLHQRLLSYVSDAIYGFYNDLKRLGKDKEVVILVFSEFGRRVPENTSLGTDHGTANNMYIIGSNVIGGHYGDFPELGDLDEGDNIKHTTDFRRVYASLIENWFDYKNSEKILGHKFQSFEIF